MPSMFDQQYLGQQITNVLGETLSELDLQNCLATIQIIEPSVAKHFWDAEDSTPGIYLVLTGKVRLLDRAENLITTLSAGSSFGEVTLFGCEGFQPYAARASSSLRLCYLKFEALQPLIDKYPSIRDRLLARAELWDLMLLFQRNSQIPNNSSDVEKMLEALSLFERHSVDRRSEISPPKDAKLWVVRLGQLLNSEGYTLIPGKIASTTQDNTWQATQPTIVYILRDADWETAFLKLPQLLEFVDPSERPTVILNDQKSPHSKPKPEKTNVIPFPQRDFTPKQKQKKSHPYFPSPKVKVGHWWGQITKSYPFFAQQSVSDCGVACLVMIGRYWGKRLLTNHLRELANVNRSGVSLRGLANAAESIGFSTRPVKASLDKFAQQPLPAIAHWQGKHYIVVYQITKTHVIVGDPAIGQRHLRRSEFIADWTGYALLIQPTELLEDTSEETTGLWKFFGIIKPHSKVLLEVFVASVLIQIFGLVTPLLTQVLLDRVIVQGSTMTLHAVGLGLLIFGLFRVFMSGVRQYLLDHTANRVSVSLLVGFIKHTFRLPLSYFESRYVGDIVSRIQENQKIQRFLTGEALSVILDLLTLLIYLGLMLSYSWQMTVLVLLIVPPFFILAFASTSILRRMSREIFNAGAEENSYLIQSLTGIRSVRSMAIEQTVRWHWEELLNKLVKKGFSAQVISNRLQIISGSIQTLMNTGLLWFGAWLVINNQLTIGQLVAFNMLMGNVLSPFQRLSVLWNQLQEIIISAERINDVLEAEPEEDLQNNPRQSLRQLQGKIEFEQVSFRYHPESDRNVLENISFEIQPEQTVAVVGRSGSGKTTLSKLILGLYPPTEGRILIDGHDVTQVSLRSLRSQVGVVDQDTFLFGATVRENISIAHPEASLEEIITAARLAGADEFIRQLPMGYETQIGEGGGMLSGGQRQRLAIARALLGNPRLLVFDEATSHLDSESERIIQNNLKTILKGRTSLIIAHRLSTVRNADLILVLDRGILVESGAHDELITKKGHYLYLNQQQLAQAG